jgi:hypothetical protein
VKLARNVKLAVGHSLLTLQLKSYKNNLVAPGEISRLVWNAHQGNQFYEFEQGQVASRMGASKGKTVRLRRGPAAVNGDESQASHCRVNGDGKVWRVE